MAAGSLSSAKKSLKALFEGCNVKDVLKGKTLIYEGDKVNKVYYVVSGYIKVCAYIGGGAQRIVFIYKKGDVFPLTTYLSGSEVARFFYETIAPVKISVLSSAQLEKRLKNDLRMGESLIQYTSAIDRQFIKRVNDMVSTDSALAKTISALKFLISQVGTGKSHVHIALPLTTKDIADISGISRAEAAVQMAYLKKKGVVAKTGSLTIDKNKLKELKT